MLKEFYIDVDGERVAITYNDSEIAPPLNPDEAHEIEVLGRDVRVWIAGDELTITREQLKALVDLSIVSGYSSTGEGGAQFVEQQRGDIKKELNDET